MILIFGGVYQGQLEYALERFGLSDNDIYRCSDDNTGEPAGKRIIYELDKWILAQVRAGIDSEQAVTRLIAGNNDAIVICNDISCGVVPVEEDMRRWREAAGRAISEIARTSDEVIRLFCGIPTVLKRM